MKKACLILLVFVLIIRLLRPYTRLGYTHTWSVGFYHRLNIESATMKPGEKISVTIVGIPKWARYSSSDFRIASVSAWGTVYAHQPGTAVISVTQGKRVYQCRVRVVTS